MALILDDAPELAYAAGSDPAHRRRFAQFFTPLPLAAFMARWILDGERSASIVDPALGLGIFARALAAYGEGSHHLTGYEIDPVLAERAEALLAGLPARLTLRVERSDFLDSDWDARHDAVICNPPWLRCRDWGDRALRFRALEDRMGVRLAGLANLHSLFLMKALHQLAEGGRAAFVLPSEFLDAGYGEPIKAYLLASGLLRHAVIFDPRRSLFAGAVTTACILLLAKGGRNTGVPVFHRAATGGDLEALYRQGIAAPASMSSGAAYPGLTFPGATCPGATPSPAPTGPSLLPAEGLMAGSKWRRHWRGTAATGSPGMVPLGTFATVLRGVATGCNAFFMLDRAAAGKAGLPAEALSPCVAKARDVASPILSSAAFADLAARADGTRPAYLFAAEGRESHAAVAAYLERGRAQGVHERFLTRRRAPWYALENRLPAPLWVSVFNRGGERLLRPVLNRAGVRNLTAFHCVYPKPGCEEWLVPLFAWLLTETAGKLVRANGRECGGGLEKIEPRDLAGALVPDFARLGADVLDAVRALVAAAEAAGEGPDPRALERAFAAR